MEGANRETIGSFIKWFLRKEDVGSNATRLNLLGFLTDVKKKTKLQLELAAVIDWGHPFVKVNLEGDRPLAEDCYETIETVRAEIHSFHTPNVQAIVQKISSSSDSHNVFRVLSKVHSRDAIEEKLVIITQVGPYNKKFNMQKVLITLNNI